MEYFGKVHANGMVGVGGHELGRVENTYFNDISYTFMIKKAYKHIITYKVSDYSYRVVI